MRVCMHGHSKIKYSRQCLYICNYIRYLSSYSSFDIFRDFLMESLHVSQYLFSHAAAYDNKVNKFATAIFMVWLFCKYKLHGHVTQEKCRAIPMVVISIELYRISPTDHSLFDYFIEFLSVLLSGELASTIDPRGSAFLCLSSGRSYTSMNSVHLDCFAH